MTPLVPATVLFGDVVDSRADPGASAFLRALRDELEAAYGEPPARARRVHPGRRAPAPARARRRPVRRGPARRAPPGGPRAPLGGGRRRGAAGVRAGDRAHGARLHRGARAARAREDAARGPARRDRRSRPRTPCCWTSGRCSPRCSRELTDRQREVARLLLVDGLRRAEAAERLGVSRATVSVIAARGRVRHLAALASPLARTFARGRRAGLARRRVGHHARSRRGRHDRHRPRPRVAGARAPRSPTSSSRTTGSRSTRRPAAGPAGRR